MQRLKDIFLMTSLVALSFGAAAQKHHHKKTPLPKKDTLEFYNLHTGENLKVIRAKGDSVTGKINWFMRDYRKGEAADMDKRVLDLLGDLKKAIRQKYPKLRVKFQVVSAYRTDDTNEMLRDKGGTQAKYSQHILSHAMDIKVPGLSTRELRDIATCLGLGGVGYYEEDGFVHVDIGRVRYWPSRDYLQDLKCPPKGKKPAKAAPRHKAPRKRH